MTTNRKIVSIDEEKCDGCGQCVPSCAEGAIQIVDGKARLVADVYCDGLGACLGECPQDAIRIIQREADQFDEAAVERRLSEIREAQEPPKGAQCGCPGAAVRELPGLNVLRSGPKPHGPPSIGPGEEGEAALSHWPIQLHLVPPGAPFLNDRDVFLAADCVPFACADFHSRILRGQPVVIGCPKLDDPSAYVEKIAAMIDGSTIRSLTVVHMEVPCCTGLMRIAEAAIAASRREVPLEQVVISIRGRILADSTADAH